MRALGRVLMGPCDRRPPVGTGCTQFRHIRVGGQLAMEIRLISAVPCVCVCGDMSMRTYDVVRFNREIEPLVTGNFSYTFRTVATEWR